MGKKLFQFIFSISSKTWVKSEKKSAGGHGKSIHGPYQPTLHDRFRQFMTLFRFRVWAPIIQVVFLAAIIEVSFPMHASASEVTLAWDDNNSTVDGYQVFQRTEGQTYDYTRPAWPTDGLDHAQNSCTIANLASGVRYFFVVRAYADGDQSSDSNEVTFVPTESNETIADGNHPPEQPTLSSFTDGQNDVSLTPLLAASDFADQDPGDSHAAAQWRILLTGQSRQIVFDRTRDRGNLLEIRIPPLVLEPSTAYSVQVRFFDDHWTASAWSPPVFFSTATDENDRNRNNIPDHQEIGSAMDMNGDTISDLDQASVVKSLFTYNELHMIGISVELNDPTVQILAAAGFAPSSLATFDQTTSQSEDKMPYGLLGYRIKVDPSEIITVTFSLSDPLPQGKTHWVRYDAVNGLSNCEASTDVGDNGRVVHRYLVDGGDEDADGAVNGVIVDLSGPLEAEANDSSLTISDDGPAAAGGGGGGCFVRTLY
jgi:hypothetical protein